MNAQIPSRDDIVDELDRVMLNLNAGGDLIIKLKQSENEFKDKVHTTLQLINNIFLAHLLVRVMRMELIGAI